LYGANKSTADNIIKNIMTTQDSMLPVPKKLGYVGGGLFALNAATILQHMTMQGVGNEAATAAAIILPAASIGRLLTKTGTAKFVQGAISGQTQSVPAKYMARFLTDALQGTKIGIQNSDGSRIWGQLSMDKNTGDPTFTKQ
jgi:K+-transporting ATPase A subunit